MMVPTADIKKRYGFDAHTVCIGKDGIETKVPNNPIGIIGGIIETVDRTCERLVVSHKKVRARYGDITLTGLRGYLTKDHVDYDYQGLFSTRPPYHFKGKNWSRIRQELRKKFCVDFPPDALTIDFGISHKKGGCGWSRGADLTCFQLVSDLIQELTELLNDWPKEQMDEAIDRLKYYGDLRKGGLLLSHIDLGLEIDPKNKNEVIISTKISITLCYKTASDEEINRKAKTLKETVMKDSPIQIESGYIPGLSLERVKAWGKVVQVTGNELGHGRKVFDLRPDGKVAYEFEFGGTGVIDRESLPHEYRAAFDGWNTGTLFPVELVGKSPLLNEDSDKIRPWELMVVAKRDVLDALEERFAWVQYSSKN